MTSPRIEVDLDKIQHNSKTLVRRLKSCGISVTGVTKAVCGHPAIAQAMLDGGITGLADARIGNIRRMRKAGLTCPIRLIRTPLTSQLKTVVKLCDASYNTDIDVIAGLSEAALQAGTVHNIILMVELGDLREGILPGDVVSIAQAVAKMKGVALKGLGANFACFGGLAPDANMMNALSTIAHDIEVHCRTVLEVVSGGNSASLPWAIKSRGAGRCNELRLGEAILLGVDPLTGDQIGGLFIDAFSLVAEVIETKAKSEDILAEYWEPATHKIRLVADKGIGTRSILAIGTQDTDVSGLTMPLGTTYLGATSDHLVVQRAHSELAVGTELRFPMNYSALMRAMAAPDIATKLLPQSCQEVDEDTNTKQTRLTLV